MKQKIYLTLSIITLSIAAYLIMINFNNYADINMFGTHTFIHRPIRVSTYTFLILIAGIFAGAGTVYMFLSAQKEKVKAYKRELEKTSISGINSASKVEVLEAKIKTLEKAFDTVIDERTKLEVQIKTLNAELDNLNNK